MNVYNNIVNRRQNQRSARACAPIYHDQLIANQLIEKYCTLDNQRIFYIRLYRRPIIRGALRSPLKDQTYWPTSQRAPKSARYKTGTAVRSSQNFPLLVKPLALGKTARFNRSVTPFFQSSDLSRLRNFSS